MKNGGLAASVLIRGIPCRKPVALANPGFQVEIEVVAAKDTK